MKKNALIGILIAINLALLTIAAAPTKKVITANEIDIVDDKGVVRARIAGHLPEVYDSGQPRRAAGFMVYDAAGQERGGYVTFASGNAALTLDSKKEMTAMLIAAPTGGAALMLKEGGNLVDVRVDPDNGPTIHAMRNKKVVYHEPPSLNFEKSPDCAELRGLLKQVSRDELLDACRRRQPEEACQTCLGGQ